MPITILTRDSSNLMLVPLSKELLDDLESIRAGQHPRVASVILTLPMATVQAGPVMDRILSTFNVEYDAWGQATPATTPTTLADLPLDWEPCVLTDDEFSELTFEDTHFDMFSLTAEDGPGLYMLDEDMQPYGEPVDLADMQQALEALTEAIPL